MKEYNNRENTPEQEGEQIGEKKKKAGCGLLLLHIIGVALASILVAWLVLGLLKLYTRHNQAITLPQLVGLTEEEASSRLDDLGLKLEVVDSIYTESKAPGTILDCTPKGGTSIKRGRTIFVTLNNKSIKKVTIPDIKDTSRRQAEALLSAQGFKHVTVKYVAGNFHDLALYIKDSSGRILVPGERAPYNEPLTLEVSSYDLLLEEQKAMEDSIAAAMSGDSIPRHKQTPNEPDNSGEDWF